jgi:hypothetical protein
VLLSVVWIFFLGVLVYGNQLRNLYFTISLSMIILFNVTAIVVYIKHIVLIRKIDYCESITDTQKRLANLQLSTFWISRILNIRNMHKWWVKRLMMSGPEYKSLIEAKKFVAEIDEFKKDLVLNREFQNR